MNIEIHHRCSDFTSYRAARVKSLFNAESGCNFDLQADLPIDDSAWRIGLVVGSSGSGKSSIGRKIFGPASVYAPAWPDRKPIVDAIALRGDFNQVTAALAAVGLGTVPAWLRPYRVLSTGQQFRANLARVICESPARVVIDEFTSVVDRQTARFGSLAFQKSWRKTSGQCVVLSCHRDIIDWVEPDWIFDTDTGQYSGRGLWRRPRFDLSIHQTDWRYWHLFEPHHYLKLPRMIAATNYVGTVEGQLVAHVAIAPRPGLVEARAARLVVMPEWQGAGIGLRFLEAVASLWLRGQNRYRRCLTTLINTSHPGLSATLRKSPRWAQVSCMLHGDNKVRSATSIQKSGTSCSVGYGGHFRAVQGFRFYGDPD
jgi:GNAT superfamily N-acetyltransferase